MISSLLLGGPSPRWHRRLPPTMPRCAARVLALLGGALLLVPGAAVAQEAQRDSIPTDVRVGILYQPAFRPGIVMPPIAVDAALQELADSARSILLRDFDYSDRLQVMSVGSDIPLEGPINYGLWDQLGAVWLLIGAIEGPADAPTLRLSLHDVVFRLLQDLRAFDLPPLGHPDFRLSCTKPPIRSCLGPRAVPASPRRGSLTSRPDRADPRSTWSTATATAHGRYPRQFDCPVAVLVSRGDRIAYMSYKGRPGDLRADPQSRQLAPSGRPARHGYDAGILAGRDATGFRRDRRRPNRDLRLQRHESLLCRAEDVRPLSNSLSPTFSPDGNVSRLTRTVWDSCTSS